MKDPRQVANIILKSIHEGDIETIIKYFNSTNKRKFSPLDEKNRTRLKKHFESELKSIGDVVEVEEIRQAPSYVGEGAVVAKIRQVENEIFVVVLTKEGDDYVFEDINSPSVKRYGQLKLL